MPCVILVGGGGRVDHERVVSTQSAKYSAGTLLPRCGLAALNELSLENNDLSPADNIPLCTKGGFKSRAIETVAKWLETWCLDIVLLTNNCFSSSPFNYLCLTWASAHHFWCFKLLDNSRCIYQYILLVLCV